MVLSLVNYNIQIRTTRKYFILPFTYFRPVRQVFLRKTSTLVFQKQMENSGFREELDIRVKNERDLVVRKMKNLIKKYMTVT